MEQIGTQILRFCSCINGVERIRRDDDGRAGADVDYCAPFPFQHPRKHGLRDLGHSLHVHLNQVPQQLLIHFVEEPRVGVGDASVVDEDTDVEPLDDLPETGDALGEVASEVDDHSLDADGGVPGSDGIGDVAELVRAAADEDEAEALAGELERKGLADPIGGASYDGPGAVVAEALSGAEEGDEDPAKEEEGDPEEGEEAGAG